MLGKSIEFLKGDTNTDWKSPGLDCRVLLLHSILSTVLVYLTSSR